MSDLPLITIIVIIMDQIFYKEILKYSPKFLFYNFFLIFQRKISIFHDFPLLITLFYVIYKMGRNNIQIKMYICLDLNNKKLNCDILGLIPYVSELEISSNTAVSWRSPQKLWIKCHESATMQEIDPHEG